MIRSKDRSLIKKARKADRFDYGEQTRLMNLCKSKEAKLEIKGIISWNYHWEEFLGGCL